MVAEDWQDDAGGDPPRLKLPQEQVSDEDPWGDDVLDRKDLAQRLTNLIRKQRAPFVISIDGRWGTGKTFLLHRWQKDLCSQDFKAIYFNAWQDDFSNDPLLGIIGQLSIHFKGGKLKEITGEVARYALPMLKANVISVLEKHSGLTLDVERQPSDRRSLIDAYLQNTATKDQLSVSLATMAQAVYDETGHPLVFIIDELDRCRPTFAIELLERVKHIFDVPHLVFVFGVNRVELVSALRSIYGEIDASTYLRRFFDMEFILPIVDPERFCQHLMQEYAVAETFEDKSQRARENVHNREFRELAGGFPIVVGDMGLSLRDIDYCVRLIALVSRNLGAGHYMHPELLTLLVALKVVNPELYGEFVRRRTSAAEVINYVNNRIVNRRDDDERQHPVDMVEAMAYRAEGSQSVLEQLRRLEAGEELSEPTVLSGRLLTLDMEKEANKWRVARMLRIVEGYAAANRGSVERLASMIDLHQEYVRA